jgi:hypothetical protein
MAACPRALRPRPNPSINGGAWRCGEHRDVQRLGPASLPGPNTEPGSSPRPWLPACPQRFANRESITDHRSQTCQWLASGRRWGAFGGKSSGLRGTTQRPHSIVQAPGRPHGLCQDSERELKVTRIGQGLDEPLGSGVRGRKRARRWPTYVSQFQSRLPRSVRI